jgi:hypothetical protein
LTAADAAKLERRVTEALEGSSVAAAPGGTDAAAGAENAASDAPDLFDGPADGEE